jgi:osmotically inducible protein OsmC
MENQTVINTPSTIPSPIKQVLYTGKVHITGGREGAAKSDDGRLNINLSTPGGAGSGTNPEQLLAAGWSACFIGAMKLNASRLHIAIPNDASIHAEVDLAAGDDGFLLQARLDISLPGLSFEQASALVEAAHETCPYSKATRGNINVQMTVTV